MKKFLPIRHGNVFLDANADARLERASVRAPRARRGHLVGRGAWVMWEIKYLRASPDIYTVSSQL
jgi:hypothetical protein